MNMLNPAALLSDEINSPAAPLLDNKIPSGATGLFWHIKSAEPVF
jgi:hypothetical protein